MNNSFPNASKGLRLVWISELLQLVGSVMLIIGVVFTLIGTLGAVADAINEVADQTASSMLTVGVILTIVGTVFAAVNYILKMVGLGTAGKDDDRYRQLMVLSIFALLIAVGHGIITAIFPNLAVANGVIRAASLIVDVILDVMIIAITTDLLDKHGDDKLVGTGRKVLWIYAIVAGITALIAILNVILRGEANAIVIGFLTLASSVLTIVYFIINLVFLIKSSNILKVVKE